MPTFSCPTEGRTFDTNDVRVTDNGAHGGRIIFIAKKECPHCGQTGHKETGTAEELNEVRN
jgi:hypothetical protein